MAKLLDNVDIISVQAAEAEVPPIERIFRDGIMAADLRDGFVAFFDLTQDANDLCIGELAFSAFECFTIWVTLTSQMLQFLG